MRIWASISDWLNETAELLMLRERLSWSEYIASLIRYHALSQKPHALTGQWAKMKGWERDKMDQGLLELVRNGEVVKGNFLRHVIREVIEEMIAEGRPIQVETVEAQLPQKTARTLIQIGENEQKKKKS